MKARMKGGPRKTCTSLQVMVKGCARGFWPTPCVADAEGGRTSKGSKRPGECGLAKTVKLWPTPAAREKGGGDYADPEKARARLESGHQVNLSDAVMAREQFPTPQAKDWRSGKVSQATLERNARPPNEAVTAQDQENGGSLNPTWTEWLQGWPLGWTDCAPLAMAGYHKWLVSLRHALLLA